MSKIEWTEKTWNPTIGCREVSPGCTNCYAARMAHRLAHIPAMAETYAGLTKKVNDKIVWTGMVKSLPERLQEPLLVKKPTVWFVDSMSDLFHATLDWNFIYKVFEIMLLTPQHTYQVLTKRAHRLEVLKDVYLHLKRNYPDMPAVLPNVWMGVSVENQKAANERIPELLEAPAAVRFLSCEPLLGPVSLDKLMREEDGNAFLDDCLTGFKTHGAGGWFANKIDWVICGGESGPGSRPMNPVWARSLRDQCAAAGVPFFFKQWGDWYTTWADISNKTDHPFVFKMYSSYLQFTQKLWVKKGDACISIDGTICKSGGDMRKCQYPVAIMQRVGKAKAGRLLDGKIYDEKPKTN